MRVVGVDGLLTPKGWVAVVLNEGQLQAIRLVKQLDDLLAEQKDADVIGVNLPLGHDDPDGTRNQGVRACDQAARVFLGAHEDLVTPVPPFSLFQGDDLEAARRKAKEAGWPQPDELQWRARERIFAIHDAVAEDARFVEIHPEVTFNAILRQLQGENARLKRRPKSWPGQYERLSLLHVAGLRPMRSYGGVGRSNPEDLLAATAAGWSAHRVAIGKAGRLPESPSGDTRSVTIRY